MKDFTYDKNRKPIENYNTWVEKIRMLDNLIFTRR